MLHLFSRYVNELSEIYFKVAKGILEHVKGAIDFTIHYCSGDEIELVGNKYSDFNWGVVQMTANLLLVLCFSFGLRLITWTSGKQESVLLSST